MAHDVTVHAFKVDRTQYARGMKTIEHSCRQICAIMHVTSRGASTSCHKSVQEVQAYREDSSKNASRFAVWLIKRKGS
jgi:hypothetical protein